VLNRWMAHVAGASISLICCLLLAPILRAENPQSADNPKQSYIPANTSSVNKSGSTGNGASDPVSPIKPPSDFRIGVADELMIAVWHEPEFSQSVVVRPDGMITVPLLNDIKVAGLTTLEMQALLTDKMKLVVNDPQVTIIVKAINSRKVWLVGNVARQGGFSLVDKKTVLELISEAGGLGPFAKARSIYILRKQNGAKVRIGFDYKKALTGKGDNPVLESGDMVVVP
jgi:polysaccharide biosynthesis/export protein